MTRLSALLILFLLSVLYIAVHIAFARIEPVKAYYYDPETRDTWEVIEYIEIDEREE